MADIEFDLNDFLSGMDKALDVVLRGIQAGVLLSSEKLRDDSVAIVPFKEGFNGGLASTAQSSPPKIEGTSVNSEVSYNKEYAVKLHEDLSLNISQEFAGMGKRRQQKYLEKPMKENAKLYGKIMSDEVTKRLNG